MKERYEVTVEMVLHKVPYFRPFYRHLLTFNYTYNQSR